MLGRPIAHSLSPVLHSAAYDALGLDWEYVAVDVGAEELREFLRGLDDTWRGLSLTMPLKRAVLPLLHDLSPLARRAGVVNTVLRQEGRLLGDNTDVGGAAAAIRERYDGPVASATVLGAGATAASVLLGLADLGCERVTLLVRDPSRAADTLAAVGRHPVPPEVDVRRLGSLAGGPAPADVLVSTVPVVAQDDLVLGAVSSATVVFDVVYDPWPTPLTAAALADERVVVTGLDLLVHQAGGQVTLMTGVERAPLEEMRAAGRAALGLW